MSWEVVPYKLASWERFPVAGVLEVNGPSLDLGLLNGTLDQRVTFARASTATDGLYTDAAGSSFNTYPSNVPRLISGSGLLVEEQRTDFLLNSGAPVTQTTASLAIGTYTLWVIGTGSATSSAGTATGSGFGAATAGAPNTFTLTVAGTVTVTVSGSLTRFQLENGAFPTSYIPTTSAAATRAADIATMSGGSWLNSSVGSLMTEAMWNGATPSGFPVVALIDDGTANMQAIHLAARDAGTSGQVYSAGTVAGFGATWDLGPNGVWAVNTIFKQATSWTAGSQNYSLNGAAVLHGAAATIPTGLNRLKIAPPAQQSVYVRRVRYWPRALSAAELQQVTAP